MTLDVLTVTLNPAIDWTVTVPGFTLGTVNRAVADTQVAGGKGVNVAMSLSDFGLSVAATGFLGSENEARFRQLFQDKGIQDEMFRLPGATRTSIKIVGGADGGTTDINFPGLPLSQAELTALEYELQHTEARWIVLAGSVPPGVSAHIYHSLARHVKHRGHKVALDSSGAAFRLALEAAPDALPDIIKPNLAEMEEFTNRKLESPEAILQAAQSLCRRGIGLVAVSMGADGALFVTETEAVWATPPAIEVQSTVGAGDALVAGLVAAAVQKLSLTESARLATAFSLDVLSRHGADELTPAAVHRWAEKVQVQSAHR